MDALCELSAGHAGGCKGRIAGAAVGGEPVEEAARPERVPVCVLCAVAPMYAVHDSTRTARPCIFCGVATYGLSARCDVRAGSSVDGAELECELPEGHAGEHRYQIAAAFEDDHCRECGDALDIERPIYRAPGGDGYRCVVCELGDAHTPAGDRGAVVVTMVAAPAPTVEPVGNLLDLMAAVPGPSDDDLLAHKPLRELLVIAARRLEKQGADERLCAELRMRAVALETAEAR